MPFLSLLQPPYTHSQCRQKKESGRLFLLLLRLVLPLRPVHPSTYPWLLRIRPCPHVTNEGNVQEVNFIVLVGPVQKESLRVDAQRNRCPNSGFLKKSETHGGVSGGELLCRRRVVILVLRSERWMDVIRGRVGDSVGGKKKLLRENYFYDISMGPLLLLSRGIHQQHHTRITHSHQTPPHCESCPATSEHGGIVNRKFRFCSLGFAYYDRRLLLPHTC